HHISNILSNVMNPAPQKSPAAILFDRYIGVDYSGARTPVTSLRGLRIYMAGRAQAPVEILPPPSRRKYWTRKNAAHWLLERLNEPTRTLIGLDHGFSFPLSYFEKYRLPLDWPGFLEDFHRHWPTDQDQVSVEDVRRGTVGRGQARFGHPRWLRLTEQRARTAKSVFRFDVHGSVAKSTHAGLPWLLMIRRQMGRHVHFWPFDGWEIPAGLSVMVEVYPSLWRREMPMEGRTPDQHDAYTVVAWMRKADYEGSLADFFSPALTPNERKQASIEGWILGVR
ncbi:MAG: hypothetical protein NZM29_07115, partial [Nitrospira sp.]|nr:hypothetical protein [Nitrospira sp.]